MAGAIAANLLSLLWRQLRWSVENGSKLITSVKISDDLFAGNDADEAVADNNRQLIDAFARHNLQHLIGPRLGRHRMEFVNGSHYLDDSGIGPARAIHCLKIARRDNAKDPFPVC